MKTLMSVVLELFGLFVEDGDLAASIVGVVIAAGFLEKIEAPSLLIGMVLYFGCILVLIRSVLREVTGCARRGGG